MLLKPCPQRPFARLGVATISFYLLFGCNEGGEFFQILAPQCLAKTMLAGINPGALTECVSNCLFCSLLTELQLLLRIEKYPHRMNFNKGILESRKQQYKHLVKLLVSFCALAILDDITELISFI